MLVVSLANAPPATAAELTARVTAAGSCWTDPPTVTTSARHALVAARARRGLDEVVDAPDAATRAARLNALLAAATAHPRLTDHAGGWHLHYRDDGLAPSGILRAVVATGTALHLVGRGMDRLGRCAREGCATIYADLGRQGTQRYCRPACANRAAVARHRARRAG